MLKQKPVGGYSSALIMMPCFCFQPSILNLQSLSPEFEYAYKNVAPKGL